MLQINIYTAPAVCGIATNLIGIFLMTKYFKDREVRVIKKAVQVINYQINFNNYALYLETKG